MILNLMIEMDRILQERPICSAAVMMGYFYGTDEGRFLSALDLQVGGRLSAEKIYQCVCFIAECVAADPLTDPKMH